MTDSAAAPPSGRSNTAFNLEVPVPFAEAFRVWLKIGFLSFGGPAGQIALMHRMLVEERRWIGEARFLHALNYCMLLPGPEAQQLATYIGWLLHRTAGGLVAGILFVLPGAAVMLALSALYAGFQELSIVQAAFFGVKAAVLAVVVEALIRISKRALRSTPMYAIAAGAFIAIFVFDVPFPAIIVTAALIGAWRAGLAGSSAAANKAEKTALEEDDSATGRALAAGGLSHTRPSLRYAAAAAAICLILWLGPIALLFATLGPENVFSREAVFFSKMAVVTFGGAYAVLAYVAQQAVEVYGWLAPGEMLDGLGLAETTPGPLIMVTQFVGFLGAYRHPGALDPMLAGTLGALITTWTTFVPCFLWIFLGAPYVEALRGRPRLSAALAAITAAVVGVILNLTVWFALHVLFGRLDTLDIGPARLSVPVWETFDPGAGVLALGAAIAMLRFHVGLVPTLTACALLGGGYWYIAGG